MTSMTALLVLAGLVILYLFACIVKLKAEIVFYRNDVLDCREKAIYWEGQYDIMADGFDALCHMTGFGLDESEEADEG